MRPPRLADVTAMEFPASVNTYLKKNHLPLADYLYAFRIPEGCHLGGFKHIKSNSYSALFFTKEQDINVTQDFSE